MIQELKELIIQSLDLEDIAPEDIEADKPLFGDGLGLGLGLDSIDALELGLSIFKKYDVKLDSHSDETKKIFSSVKSLAEYIESSRKK